MTDPEDADDAAFVARLRAEQRTRHAAQLADAKAEAARRGKEPFDLDRFDALAHPPSPGTRDEQLATYERQYYVHHPSVMTIAAFAELLMRLDVDKDR